MASNQIHCITGARKGIGRALAEHLLAQGKTVVGCSRRRADWNHPNYTHHCLDIADEKAVIGLVRQIKRDHGRLDVLVNNAGIAAMNHLMLTPVKTAQVVMQTNFLGSLIFLRECAKLMSRSQYGRIINFTTVARPLNLEGEAVYAASKAAIESLTRIAAKEFGPMGITVNAVGPTPVRTDLIKLVPEAKLDALLEQQAIKRFGELKDVMHVVDFFSSPASDFVTGQVLYLGGVTQ